MHCFFHEGDNEEEEGYLSILSIETEPSLSDSEYFQKHHKKIKKKVSFDKNDIIFIKPKQTCCNKNPLTWCGFHVQKNIREFEFEYEEDKHKFFVVKDADDGNELLCCGSCFLKFYTSTLGYKPEFYTRTKLKKNTVATICYYPFNKTIYTTKPYSFMIGL